jgi:periplasmic protein TonB
MTTPRLPPPLFGPHFGPHLGPLRALLPCLHAPARFTLILAAHALLIGGVWQVTQRPPAPQQPEMQAIELRTIEAPKPLPQLAPPPPAPRRSAPTLTPPTSPPRPAPHTQPVLAAPQSVTSPADFTVPTTPDPTPAPAPAPEAPHAAPEAPRPAPITPARFDADYLQNPAPAYPVFSRRQGEQGRVLLAVRVSAEGRAEEVQIKQTSGHPRLDEAALAAVRQWRFVPARRGDEAVAANVVVPITFRLDN